jgi:hypothetical protein
VANFLADDERDQGPTGGLTSLFPPAPLHETHTTTEGGSSTPVATPEYTKAIGDVAATSNEQADALEAKGLHDSDVAEAMKQEAANQLAEMDKVRAEKAAESARQAGNIKAQADVLRSANQELRATPAPALFHDGDGWKNVARAVALAVAAFGDALAAKGAALGGRSSSQNSVQTIVNNQLEMEREKIKKLTDNQVMAKTGLKDAMDARATALAEIDARGAEAMRRAQMLGDYMVKSAGPQGAVLQARLDSLALKQHENEFRAQSLAALHKTVTSRHTTENIDRDPQVKPPGANQIPTHIPDQLTDTDIPVDPTATNGRQHATAVNDLAPIDTFLDTGMKMLADAKSGGPARNALIARWTNGDTTQGGREATAIRLRSAYAAAKHESIGEGNSKHLEAALPDPPSSMAPDGAWKEWITRYEASVDEMRHLRNSKLANAGVNRDEIKKADAKIEDRFKAPPSSVGHDAGRAHDVTKPPEAAAKAATPSAPAHVVTNPQTGERLKYEGGKWVPL